MEKETLNIIREMLREELEPIKSDIKDLKKGQDGLEREVKEIKTMLGELDPKNTNRHLELQESIDLLKENMSTLEIVTASNYSDIVRLKATLYHNK